MYIDEIKGRKFHTGKIASGRNYPTDRVLRYYLRVGGIFVRLKSPESHHGDTYYIISSIAPENNKLSGKMQFKGKMMQFQFSFYILSYSTKFMSNFCERKWKFCFTQINRKIYFNIQLGSWNFRAVLWLVEQSVEGWNFFCTGITYVRAKSRIFRHSYVHKLRQKSSKIYQVMHQCTFCFCKMSRLIIIHVISEVLSIALEKVGFLNGTCCLQIMPSWVGTTRY